MSRKLTKDDVRLVGLQEIAALCGVETQTAYRWRWRKTLVEPDWTFGDTPVWLEDTVVEWAKATGRLDAQGQPVKKANGWVELPDGSKTRDLEAVVR